MKFSPAEFDDALPRYEDLSPRVSLEAFKPPMIHTTNSVSGWRESDLDRGVAVSGCFPSRPALVRSPGKLIQSAWGACRRALSVFSTQPPAPAPIPFYHIEQANTAVQIRMSHTLSLLIAVLCDSTTPSKQDLETEDFDQEQVFRNQWATPTIIHLRNQQRDGSLSPAMAREVGIFCRFLNDTVLSMPHYDAAERASTARLAWQAVNQNDFSILGDSFDEDETASLFGWDYLEGKTDLWVEESSPESSTDVLAEPEPLHLVPCLTTPTPSPPNRAFFMPARFAMANTLREFSDIMDDDEFFSLAEFRTECFDPAVEKVLDALRDGMGSDDEAQQDATTWLRFMRQSMQAIEEECSERDPVLNALGIRTLTMSSLSRRARDAFVSDDFGRLR